jgi:hypothetical protein
MSIHPFHLGAWARVADRDTLRSAQREALRTGRRPGPTPAQMRCAGRDGRVRRIRRAEDGHSVYELEGLPGAWPEAWLAAA